MTQSVLSLKWLDTFRRVAQSGSMQQAAEQSGQSISTVSHHLKCLEDHLAAPLLDHTRRPMVLTPQGVIYLRYAEEALGLLAKAEVEMGGLAAASLRDLRFAMIEDFESDIGPEVTRMLAASLPGCRFTHYTRTSHDILSLLRNRKLDLGVATQPPNPLADVEEHAVLRDPFVLAVPSDRDEIAEDYVTCKSTLPFLRYSREQIMGQLIEAQLTRLRLKLENAFELDSTSSIIALVAQGQGWAITTPTNYARSKRFQSRVTLLPFPRKEFARTISVFVADPKAQDVARSVVTAMRSLVATHTIAPVVGTYPWLIDRFRVLAEDG
jgi:DNA-binding transcriptional LysR family regulator